MNFKVTFNLFLLLQADGKIKLTFLKIWLCWNNVDNTAQIKQVLFTLSGNYELFSFIVFAHFVYI